MPGRGIVPTEVEGSRKAVEVEREENPKGRRKVESPVLTGLCDVGLRVELVGERVGE